MEYIDSNIISLSDISADKLNEVIGWLSENIEELGSDPKVSWPVYSKNNEWRVCHIHIQGMINVSIKFMTLSNATLFKLRFG